MAVLPILKFEYKKKPHEVRAIVVGDKFVIRVLCEGDAVGGIGYSISAKRGDLAPTALMHQAQREVQSGCAAEGARIARAVENQMERLRLLASGSKQRWPKKRFSK
jgi:hypothetical protein